MLWHPGIPALDPPARSRSRHRGNLLMNSNRILRTLACALALLISLGLGTARAADEGMVAGTVVDALGGHVSGAAVKLVRDGKTIAETSSDARGEFAFKGLAEGRYQLDVASAGFATRITDPVDRKSTRLNSSHSS